MKVACALFYYLPAIALLIVLMLIKLLTTKEYREIVMHHPDLLTHEGLSYIFSNSIREYLWFYNLINVLLWAFLIKILFL